MVNSMLYDSGFILIRLIHELNSYINSDLLMIAYGGAKISPMCNGTAITALRSAL